jgi:ribosomal protein L37AE/L43A
MKKQTIDEFAKKPKGSYEKFVKANPDPDLIRVLHDYLNNNTPAQLRKESKLYQPSETIVTAATCPTCKDKIYSRARHDFHYCSCGEIAVDGGRDYFKMSFKEIEPEISQLAIPVSQHDLYQDWNNEIDKYGIIKCK